MRSISNDLHMEYAAVGQTTHLAARMQQVAPPDTIRLTAATVRLVEGLVRVKAMGPVPIKGLAAPVEVFELLGASGMRRRLQAATARGLTRFVGRQTELAALHAALAQAGAGHGQVVAVVGEAGVGKSRLVDEFVQAAHAQGWLVLDSAAVSYGQATPYFPVLDLLRRYCHLEEREDTRTIQAKVTEQVQTLDAALEDTIPALLALLDALPADSPFWQLDAPQRRQRTLFALKRVLLRESQTQPLLLVCEDLHWLDTETQALLESLSESLPTARLLLLVNYRPDYRHGWGSKTYYTQLRLDPLPPASADAFLAALLGDDPSLAPLTPLLIAAHGGQSLLPGGERADAGGDWGPGGGARGLPPGAGPADHADAGHRAGRPGGAYRPLATGGEAPAPDRSGHWDGGPAGPPPGRGGAAGRGAPPGPHASPGRRVPVRGESVPRAGLHLQARPDAGGGLRQPAARAAAGAPCRHCRGPGDARRGPDDRAGRTPGPPCPAGRGVGQGPGVLLAGGGEGPGAVSPPRGRGVLRAGAQCPCRICRRRATHASRPSISGSPCARRSIPLAIAGRILAALREAESLAEALDDPRRLGQVSVFLSDHFYNMSAYDQSITTAHRVLALATAGADVVMQAQANHALGRAYHAQGDYRRAIDCLGQTVAPFEGARRHERFGRFFLPAVTSRVWLAACHAELGTFAEGTALGEEGLRIAEAVAHPASLMWAYYGIGLLSLRQGDLSRALSLLERAMGICHEADLPFFFPGTAAALGTAYVLDGRVTDAVLLLTQAMEQSTATESAYYETFCGLSLGEAHMLAGRLEEAHARAERTLALARAYQERGNQAYALRLLGDLAAQRDPPEVEPAEAHYRQALTLAENSACAHSRPTVTAASARYTARSAAGAGPHRAVDGHRPLPRHGDDLLAAPGRGRAGAGGCGSTMTIRRLSSIMRNAHDFLRSPPCN